MFSGSFVAFFKNTTIIKKKHLNQHPKEISTKAKIINIKI